LRGGGVVRAAAGSGPAGVFGGPAGVVVIVVVEAEVRRTRNWQQCASTDTTDGVALRRPRAVNPWPRARSSMWGAWGSLETAIRRLSLFSNGLAVVNGNACYGQYYGLSRTALSRRRLARHRLPRSEWARLIIVLASSNPDPHDIHHVHSPHRRRLQSSSHTLCTRVLRVSRLSNRHQDSASDYYVSSCLDPIHPIHPLHPLHNLALAPSACTGSSDRASIQLATSSLNASLSLPGSSCTVAVSPASPHTMTCSHRW
jgi:hypothetical protein